MYNDFFDIIHRGIKLDPLILFDYFEKGFFTGFLIGGYLGARRMSLQFLAENQHYLPLKSRNEMLLYSRDRNYKIMSGFVASGTKKGFQIGTLCFAFKFLRELFSEFAYVPGDLIASSLCGCTAFLLTDKRNKLYNCKKGFKYGFISGCLIMIVEEIKNINTQGYERLKV